MMFVMAQKNKQTFAEWWAKNEPVVRRIAGFLIFLPKFRGILLQLIAILNSIVQDEAVASMQVGEKVNDDMA